jgi:hypothetical protein
MSMSCIENIAPSQTCASFLAVFHGAEGSFRASEGFAGQLASLLVARAVLAALSFDERRPYLYKVRHEDTQVVL